MTTSIDNLNALLNELGPAASEVTLIEQISPTQWLIALDDFESAIALRIDQDTGVITLACELGRPQESEQFRIYEALLTYNGLAELHGGIRMALRGPGGMVLQEFDIHLQYLDLDLLRKLINDFAKKASAWEEIIESAEAPEVDEGLQSDSWNGLRV